ncbi:ABC transporter ATP-binding protein [Bradyrhizobium sp.]|uniref:ABC transporter ATP-binding protein n=1 Tax=Bradyrhizobium sp. TaxID=376 RepID=UPI0039E2B6F5
MSTILSVRGLNAYYSLTQALRDVSFELVRGGITTILGANGAGKTTTLRAICGMVKVTGEILLDGKRIDRLSTEKIASLGVAHVPDGRGTIGALTVEDNLRIGAFTRRDREVSSDIQKCYDYFPRLRERAKQNAGELSGGEQQMLAISRALMLRPKVLLLDEPSFGLAPLVIRDIFAILRAINATDKVSMLIVEQNARLALGLADHASLLETGSIVMSGSSAAIQENDAIRQSYLGY